MKTLDFVTLDVFTDRRFGGNPLAIFPDARELDTADMLNLARELNMSEVVFLLPPEDPANTARLRIFTSTIEIDFAGHPNVGAGWLLAGEAESAHVLRLEQKAGVVEVEVSAGPQAQRHCRIAAPRPLSIGEAPPASIVAACASLGPAEIGPPRLATVSLATVCCEVSIDALARAKCDPAAFESLAQQRPDLAEICLLYLYARDGNRLDGRMFAPLSGTTEDPATGSAVSALTALLLHESGEDRISIDVTQGVLMGRPSRIQAEARRVGDEIRAWVSGTCVPVLRGQAMV